MGRGDRSVTFIEDYRITKEDSRLSNRVMWIKCPPTHILLKVYIFEENKAVIKMIIKGRSLTMRHVSRTHRVALDRLFDRINLHPRPKIKYVTPKTNSQTY